jgi:hypothetical protein
MNSRPEGQEVAAQGLLAWIEVLHQVTISRVDHRGVVSFLSLFQVIPDKTSSLLVLDCLEQQATDFFFRYTELEPGFLFFFNLILILPLCAALGFSVPRC